MVQAAHAAIQATNSFPNVRPSLVVLEVEDASHLARAVTKARAAGIDITVFFETDDDMGYTAAATGPISDKSVRKHFRDYSLWTE